MTRFSRRLTMTMIAALALPAGAVAQYAASKAPLKALDTLEPGLWQLRELGAAGAEVKAVCLGDPQILMQIRHRGAACEKLVLSNQQTSATVQYTCAGAGWGRTTVTVETARLLRLDTQGIASNRPFAFAAEGRRIGECDGRETAAR